MPYINPEHVDSPKDSWVLDCVIYDEGEDRFAVSFGEWNGVKVIAIRWNGTDKANKGLSNPQSSGHATWFVLPQEIGISVVMDIIVKQAAGNTNIRTKCLPKVIYWLKDIQKISPSMYEHHD